MSQEFVTCTLARCRLLATSKPVKVSLAVPYFREGGIQLPILVQRGWSELCVSEESNTLASQTKSITAITASRRELAHHPLSSTVSTLSCPEHMYVLGNNGGDLVGVRSEGLVRPEIIGGGIQGMLPDQQDMHLPLRPTSSKSFFL